MAKLQSKDFKKGSKKGLYTGKTRKEIVFLKIKEGRPFIIGPKSEGQSVIGIDYKFKNKNGWPATLTYILPNEKKIRKNYKEIKLGEIFKDPDFGGGGGSGGGSDLTKYVESLQCFYCSLVFNVLGKEIDVNNFEKRMEQLEELPKAASWCDTTEDLLSCQKNAPAVWIDGLVFERIANKIYSDYKNKFRGKVYFHRGSKFMGNIYKAKRETHKNDKLSENPQAPGSFSDDKWNPGDIWATTYGSSDKPLNEFTGSWGELNNKVLEEAGIIQGFNEVKLLGISLKKVGNTIKVTHYNLPNKRRPKSIYKNYTWGKTNDFFSSKDVYVKSSSGEVQFRNFNGEKSWQGTITGTSAYGGKIGGGNVDFYLKKVYGKSVSIYSNNPSYNNTKTEKALFSKLTKDFKNRKKGVVENYYAQYVKYTTGDQLELDDFYVKMCEVEKKGSGFISSKFLCLQLIDILHNSKSSKKLRDEFITLVFLYASSNTKQSSYFIKVHD